MYFLLASLLVRLNNFSFVYWYLYFFWEKPPKSCPQIWHLSVLQLDKINKIISVSLFALFRFGNILKYFDSNIHISLKHQQFLPNRLCRVFVFCSSMLGLIRFPCRIFFCSHSMWLWSQPALWILFWLPSDASQTLSGATDHTSTCLPDIFIWMSHRNLKISMSQSSSSSLTFTKPAPSSVSPPPSAYPPRYLS